MTAAPERIWAMPDFTDHDDGTWSFGEWLGHKPDFTNGCIEYIAVTALSRAPEVQELIRQAVEAERERCAKVAIGRKGDGTATLDHPYDKGYLAACDVVASAIRAGE